MLPEGHRPIDSELNSYPTSAGARAVQFESQYPFGLNTQLRFCRLTLAAMSFRRMTDFVQFARAVGQLARSAF